MNVHMNARMNVHMNVHINVHMNPHVIVHMNVHCSYVCHNDIHLTGNLNIYICS